MNEVNRLLLEYIAVLHYIIQYLVALLFGKVIGRVTDDIVSRDYRKLEVDPMPIFYSPEKKDYFALLAEYETVNGKPLKPVKHRLSAPDIKSCPCCDAPAGYVYDNTGGRGQFLCKVCNTRFNRKSVFSKDVVLKCPSCNHTLVKIKSRKDFSIHKCLNDYCSFYRKKLTGLSRAERKLYAIMPSSFKLRYIFRKFNFDFQPLSSLSPVSATVDLARIQSSSHLLGLVLTYYVNYSLSSRKTAAIINDVHQVSISHQTVLNYAEAVANTVKPFTDNFPYVLSSSFCGDETYIKINGRWNYLFFFFDSVKKLILSYRVSALRDTFAAVRALDDVLSKLKVIPENLNFVTDGNPIYLLAQHFFAGKGIRFNITQVIGLTNDDPVSTAYRPLKQIIERLNRTFKSNYRGTNGFGSIDGSASFVTLFATYFNFLRPHSSLEKRTPVVIPDLEGMPHMPGRWNLLIEMAEHYIISGNFA